MLTIFTVPKPFKGIFKWSKDKIENSLKVVTVFVTAATFLVAALTIPFFRYLHPVVPLVYVFAISTLVWVVEKMAQDLRFKIFNLSKNKKLEKTIHKSYLFNLNSNVLSGTDPLGNFY